MTKTTTNEAGSMFAADTLCEVRQAGTTEEGEPRLVDVWVVFATNADGRRFVARRAFCSDDYRDLLGEKVAAEAFVKVVQAALDAGADPSTSDKWREMDPAYGSVEYQRQGTEEAWAARERSDDEQGL